MPFFRFCRNGILLLPALMLALFLCPAAALAEEAPCTAADAAALMREGTDSPLFASWENTIVHKYEDPDIHHRFVVKSMLNHLTGQGAAPVTDTALALVPCSEAPLPTQDMVLYRGVHYNLHGLILSDTPLKDVTVTITHKSDSSSIYPMVGKVEIPAELNLTEYSLDDTEIGETKPVNSLVNFNLLKYGRHNITITASNGEFENRQLFSADFTIEDSGNRYPLLQCNFGDNYSTALRFFQYDPERFMFHYSLRGDAGDDRMMSTATDWREAYMVDTETIFGRVHRDAEPYFMKALEYLENSYVRVQSENRDSKVRKLITLIGDECGTYVPRFQNNARYISHHSFGTCVDINYDYYPNKDIITNHELIGNDVRDHLIYNGIKTDENGQQYYDFTYTGDYPARVNKIPTTVINYLLYELAFYRAGFSWGYYYITSCDGMHFTLSDSDYSRHTSELMGLRKVYEYCN